MHSARYSELSSDLRHYVYLRAASASGCYQTGRALCQTPAGSNFPASLAAYHKLIVTLNPNASALFNARHLRHIVIVESWEWRLFKQTYFFFADALVLFAIRVNLFLP